MKKIPKTVACLLLATQMSAQVADTTCEMIRGKCNYKFDYNTSKILHGFDTCRSYYGPTMIWLDSNEVLCLHLYDKGGKQLFFRRRVTVYYRDGSKDYKRLKSKSNFIYLPGKEIERVKVGVPFAVTSSLDNKYPL